ncbi:MAG: pirin family protein [Alphaproteobacteria bacterium]|nr:pirin family protein [Alphaproteobacteria bacterium]
MITVYPYEKLGHADHGWLNARHHFSFANYHNRARMGFGALRVINDDIIEAGRGFGAHPHDNMEIITYVRSGAITHKDSMGNIGKTAAGDVQVMSAGKGVFHGEYNAEPVNTTLYQIWILPAERNVEPRWEAKQFPKKPVADALPVLVSGQPEHKHTDALFIHQDAAIYGGNLVKGTKLKQSIKHMAYVLASEGEFTVNGALLKKGDGAEVTDSDTLSIIANTDAEIVVIDVPK